MELTVEIRRSGDWYVAHCLELDIASQGETEGEARQMIVEAVTLFLETASPAEIQERLEEYRRSRTEPLTTLRIAVSPSLTTA